MDDKSGKITRQEDGFKVVFERVLNHNINKVWEAITDPEKLKFWFTDIEIDFKVGGKIKFIDRNEEKSVSFGHIISIDKPNKYEFMWEGDLAVWELISTNDDKCRLRLTYSKIDDDYVIKTPVGWHMLLDRLQNMLDGKREILPFGEQVESMTEFQNLTIKYENIFYTQFPDMKI